MNVAGRFLAATVTLVAGSLCGAGELTVEDFKFDGPIGSEGAKAEKLERNHFKITLGHAPENPGWANHLQFQILRNAKGNTLRLTVEFVGEIGTSSRSRLRLLNLPTRPAPAEEKPSED